METILVTAVGSFSADAVIRTYKREGFRVLGCDVYPARWVVNSRDVELFYQAPYATDSEAYTKFIERICREQQVDYLVPLTDGEVDVLTGLDPSVLAARVCISNPEAIALCRDKYEMGQFLKDRGICLTIPGMLMSQVKVGELAYPMVVKPRNGRSSQGMYMVKNQTRMAQVMEECAPEADNYLVQPRMPGTVVTVDVVRDSKNGIICCLPRRELLRTLNGAGTSVYVFRDKELERQCREIAEAVGIEGCVNMEFIEEDEADGRKMWYFLECNPRFSGGVAFSVMAGYDMVKNHLRCFEGSKIQRMGAVKARFIARRYQEYVMDQIEGPGTDPQKGTR